MTAAPKPPTGDAVGALLAWLDACERGGLFGATGVVYNNGATHTRPDDAATTLRGLLAEIVALRGEVDEARADAERMDRIEAAWGNWDVRAIYAIGLDSNCPTIRDAIDNMEAL